MPIHQTVNQQSRYWCVQGRETLGEMIEVRDHTQRFAFSLMFVVSWLVGVTYSDFLLLKGVL
jgi:hypothetical protein